MANTQINPIINITNQPTPVIYSNLNLALNPPRTNPNQDWNSGLLDCFSDCSEFILAFFCTYCHMIGLFSRANEECCSCVFGGLVPLRTKIRTERGIKGSICKDFCVIYWCGFCAILQMGRELKTSKPLI